MIYNLTNQKLMLTLKEELELRWLYYQYTNEKLFDEFEQGGKKFYIGYDPTADSLTIWHFCTIMVALQFLQRGNTFVVIIWWATGMIGDPSFKDAERNFLDEATLRHNQQAIKHQIEWILENISTLTGKQYNIEVYNNYDFYKDMNALDYLRTVGKYITVNSMIGKDSISRRLTDGNFISYTEFSYTLLQGYDFVKLNQDYGVSLQLWASDQWGNITTGTEMIRKMTDNEAYGFTFPLVLDSTGKKFGKSEGNAIWLDPKKNSPWVCYNYFMNASDEDLGRYLKIFTLKTLEEIQEILTSQQQNPSARTGQQKLAYLATQIVFWTQAAEDCNSIRLALFWWENPCQQIETFEQQRVQALSDAIGSVQFKNNQSLIDVLVETWLCVSRGDAKKDIQANAICINETKITDINYLLSEQDFLQNGVSLIRKGKKTYKIITKV